MKTNPKSGRKSGSPDGFFRKLLFMTIVVLSVYVVLGIIGFFLWFAFPVDTIHGLTYLKGNNLISYYLIVNTLDIAGVLLFSHWMYYKMVNTRTPVQDGIWLGLYLIVMSWVIDLVVYVVIRKTLPTIHEYFLGKNQPEIGIAWIIAFCAAVGAGYIHMVNNKFDRHVRLKKAIPIITLLIIASVVLTVLGIRFFDVKP